MIEKIFSGIIGAATGSIFVISIMSCADGKWLQGIFGFFIALLITGFDFVMFNKNSKTLFPILIGVAIAAVYVISILACIAGYWGQGIFGIIIATVVTFFALILFDVIRFPHF